MSIRSVALLSLVAVVGSVACAEDPSEPRRRIQQRLDGVDDDDPGAEAGSECAHPICAGGDELTRGCDPCADMVCAADPYCCDVTWDVTCVGEVTSICGKSCKAPPPTGGGAGECAHPVCTPAGPLESACGSCPSQLCAQDPYCCAVAWDETCVTEVGSVCGVSCN